MDKDYLTLKRASASRQSGEWGEGDYDVLADGAVVGRIVKAAASPVGRPWMWTLLFGYHEDRTPTHGYEPTRGCDGGVRQELAPAIAPRCPWRGAVHHDQRYRNGKRTQTGLPLAKITVNAQSCRERRFASASP
jgi:hypothetical protein